MIHDPSATDVWFDIGGEVFPIKPGETINLKS